MSFLTQAKLLCINFVRSHAGCKFPEVGTLRKYMKPGDEWLLEVQGGWQDAYGYTRSLQKGMIEDWFSKEGLLYCVKQWPGALLYDGPADQFSGSLLMLPRMILTDSEFSRQVKMMSCVPKKALCKPAFVFVTFRLIIKPDLPVFIPEVSPNRNYSVIVPRDVTIRLGLRSGADFAQEVLLHSVSTADRPSKIATTIVSGVNWDVRVLTVSPCLDVIDGSNVQLLNEVLEFPPRIIALGRKGSGKSRLSKLFSIHGYNVFDSDAYGRILQLAGPDICEEKIVEAVTTYLRLTPDERKQVPNIFEVEMESLLEMKYRARGLRSYSYSKSSPIGRLDEDLFLEFNVIYDKIVRLATPEDVRGVYFKLLWGGIGFDDTGNPGFTANKALIFCHTLIEQFQAMSASLIEIIPTHSTRVAIQLRGQGVSADAELFLHDFYVAKNGNGVGKVGLGWLSYFLHRMNAETSSGASGR
nr:VP8 [Jeddah tick coltivirus]